MLETFVPIPYVDEDVAGATSPETLQKTSNSDPDKLRTVPVKGNSQRHFQTHSRLKSTYFY